MLRISSRSIRAPDRYSPSLHYLLLTDEGEPESFDEALQVEDSIKWEQAMDDEMRSLEKNYTWVLTELPAGKRALLNKWVFRIKTQPHGKRRFKARLVVKGYSKRKGIDYAKIFYPLVKLTSIQILLTIVASENLHLEQMDVKQCFYMEIWIKRSICSNRKDLWFQARNTWCARSQELVWTKASTKEVVQEV